MSICLFGGTFDPPHNGHIRIAESVRKQLQIDTVLFIPAFIPPHKQSHPLSSTTDRLAMLRLAIEGKIGFEICEIEIQRGDVSYSIDTIRAIRRARNLKRNELYFLIGADSLLELHLWKNPAMILTESRVLVAARPNFDLKLVRPEFRSKVEIIESPLMDISSSLVRDRVKNGQSIRELVPAAVAAYILEKRLYLTKAHFIGF
jgi:nicotinate-nucleotide adenylyltransferase